MSELFVSDDTSILTKETSSEAEKPEIIVTLESTHSQLKIPFRRLRFTPDKESLQIGRTSNRLSDYEAQPDNAYFKNPVVSRKHGIFVVDFPSKTVYVRDINSLHGTYLNQQKLASNVSYVVRTNDILTFGAPMTSVYGWIQPCSFHVSIGHFAHSPSSDISMPAPFGASPNSSDPRVFRVPEDTDESSNEEDDNMRDSEPVANSDDKDSTISSVLVDIEDDDGEPRSREIQRTHIAFQREMAIQDNALADAGPVESVVTSNVKASAETAMSNPNESNLGTPVIEDQSSNVTSGDECRRDTQNDSRKDSDSGYHITFDTAAILSGRGFVSKKDTSTSPFIEFKDINPASFCRFASGYPYVSTSLCRVGYEHPCANTAPSSGFFDSNKQQMSREQYDSSCNEPYQIDDDDGCEGQGDSCAHKDREFICDCGGKSVHEEYEEENDTYYGEYGSEYDSEHGEYDDYDDYGEQYSDADPYDNGDDESVLEELECIDDSASAQGQEDAAWSNVFTEDANIIIFPRDAEVSDMSMDQKVPEEPEKAAEAEKATKDTVTIQDTSTEAKPEPTDEESLNKKAALSAIGSPVLVSDVANAPVTLKSSVSPIPSFSLVPPIPPTTPFSSASPLSLTDVAAVEKVAETGAPCSKKRMFGEISTSTPAEHDAMGLVFTGSDGSTYIPDNTADNASARIATPISNMDSTVDQSVGERITKKRRVRLGKIASAVGFFALGTTATSIAILSAMIATAPSLT